ncbi:MAG: glutamate--cysteine ligase [Pseudomonadota bacterium]|uniref:glutamate--cysteine ligase n=1 Tax=unclassified Phenylobacterium TaxID=2640670 RepID=UPI0006F3115D|nr:MULTISPECIES: glutamate--cysteine ligase [unclassified Phenylobacterium]KRB52016.1 glutamate--cysteine ligase [Phenylobacterium sp. Root700]MBT9471169.1 glutamate--cysteine ligase [Phenylobacterium sp.]
MADVVTDDRPLTFEDLIQWFEAGSKPVGDWKVGAEHEKFVFRLGTYEPIPYGGPAGIQALLNGLTRFGWKGVYEGENIIALERGKANVSLEPGGQFELSGAPLETMHDICEETGQHLEEVKTVADELGLGFLGLGYTPLWRRDEIPVMPKGRYKIMREYMPKVGNLGLDMMFRTCTVQANLDFGSEADMVAKFRTSLALQPIATALFANSPFIEGKPSGFLSARANVWTDTDPDRTGMLDFVFADGFGFETYANYALDVPMYFAKRDGKYVDLSGRSFRKFMAGELSDLPGDRPSIKDWADHTTTAFPEVRLKQYLEMRGADSGPWSRLCALPALWAGIFYDSAALAAAWDLCKDWKVEDHERLRADVARLGLKAQVNGRSVQDVAKDMVAIARQGLKNRNRLSAGMVDEGNYLTELEDIADSGITPAERLLELYNGPWNGDVRRAFEDFAY